MEESVDSRVKQKDGDKGIADDHHRTNPSPSFIHQIYSSSLEIDGCCDRYSERVKNAIAVRIVLC